MRRFDSPKLRIAQTNYHPEIVLKLLFRQAHEERARLQTVKEKILSIMKNTNLSADMLNHIRTLASLLLLELTFLTKP